MKTKLFFVVTLFWVLFISAPAPCQDEQITLSTYYPAPYGEYDELCAEKLLVDTPSAAELQDMARGDCHITRSLIVGTTGGGFSYDALNTAGTPLYDGDVIIEGSLGIGTRDPNAKLQINYGTVFVKQTALGVGGVTNIFLGSNTDFASGIGQAYFGITTGLANGVPLGGSATYHWGAVTSSDDTTRRLFHFGYFPDDDMTNNFVSNAWINGRNGAAYFAGNVGIGTTNPVAPLTVERNADVYLGHIIAVCSDDNDAVLALATATAAEDAAIFLDKSDSNKLKIALGNTAFTADRNTSTKLTIQQGGNLGIGTTSPGAKLEVAGDAKITGGLKPDYDSGWYADNAQTNHKTTLTHNLGVIPSRIQFWFSPDNPPSNWVYPVSVYGMSIYDDLSTGLGYRTPEGIRVNTTTLEYLAFYRTYMYSYYDITTPETDPPSVRWVRWDTGYYRVQMWK